MFINKKENYSDVTCFFTCDSDNEMYTTIETSFPKDGSAWITEVLKAFESSIRQKHAFALYDSVRGSTINFIHVNMKR